MTRTMHRRLVRLQSYVDPALADKVDRYCEAKGLSESKLIKSLVSKHLDGTSDSEVLQRRLGRIEKAIARHHRDDEFHAEAFAVFVQVWYAHMPSIPEDRKAAALAQAERQFKHYTEHVARHFARGERFLDTMPTEQSTVSEVVEEPPSSEDHA